MNKVSQEYTLGFFDTNGIFTIYAKQFDTQRELVFYLEDDLVEHILEKNTYLLFREVYADGTSLFPTLLDPSCLDATGHKVTFMLSRDMLAVEGIARCELAFIQSNGTIVINDDGSLPNIDYTILTTQDFNINIKPNATGDLSDFDPEMLDMITRLAIALGILKNELEAGEKERKRAEYERRAYEASGSYDDESGNHHMISWYDSRRGTQERYRALAEGGSYTDENGETQIVKNQYTNLKGEIIYPDIEDLKNTSWIALAAYMKSLSDNNYWATLSESWAHGGTGLEDRPDEDVNNSEYFAHRSAENQANARNYMERTQQILDSLNGYLDANLPDCMIDLETGHLFWEGGIFNFLVTYYDGHLKWEAVAGDDGITGGNSSDVEQLAAKVHSLQQDVQRLNRLFDNVSYDLENIADKSTLDQIKEDSEYIKNFINRVMNEEDDA